MMFNVQEVGGGAVQSSERGYGLHLPAGVAGYANAQFDDYAGDGFLNFRPIQLTLNARFSHDNPVGTAGFGFWNAPYGDPNVRRPAFPKAVWFFYAAPPNDLPFLLGQTGWFAATINVRPWQAMLAPLAILNWLPKVQSHLWPRLTRALGIRVARVPVDITQQHRYQIDWSPRQTAFRVDGHLLLQTTVSPSVPLGFVAWIDNQYLIATPKGRFGAGVSPVSTPQSLSIHSLSVRED